MIVTCVTCRYLPSLRYIARLCEVDRVVMLDMSSLPHQYKHSFISRNRIRDKTGRLLWLSVPVHRKGEHYIARAQIDVTQHNWIDKHIRRIAQTYPHHRQNAGNFLVRLEEVLRNTDGSLLDVNVRSLRLILEVLGLGNIDLLMESSVLRWHDKNHRLEVSTAMGATEYVAGRVERKVMEESGCIEDMMSAGIRVYASPELDHKLFDIDVIERLSCVHAICTLGPERARQVIDGVVLFLRDRLLGGPIAGDRSGAPGTASPLESATDGDGFTESSDGRSDRC